jgi:hypothetical protein
MESAVDQNLRRRLIEALTSRSWESVDAERAAIHIEALYELEPGEWKVLLWTVARGEGTLFLVARRVNGPAVFDSALEARALDVAGALNEIEVERSEPPGSR